MKPYILCLIICLFANAIAVASSQQVIADIPSCEIRSSGSTTDVTIGVTQPYASLEVVKYAVELSTRDQGISVCSESWESVLPHGAPWAIQLERGYGWVIFALIFLGIVTFLSAYTPRQWWRRTNLIGVLAVGGLTWLGGVAVLATVNSFGVQRTLNSTVVSIRTQQQPMSEWLEVTGARDLEIALVQRRLLRPSVGENLLENYYAGGYRSELMEDAMWHLAMRKLHDPSFEISFDQKVSPMGYYVVFHRLNLREWPGVNSPLLTVLPVGEQVFFDGAMDNDWWRVRSASGQYGWVIRLWLRRPNELLSPAVEAPWPPQIKP